MNTSRRVKFSGRSSATQSFLINMDEAQATRALRKAQQRAMVKVILEQVLGLHANDKADKEFLLLVKELRIRAPSKFLSVTHEMIRDICISDGNNGTKPVPLRPTMTIANIQAFVAYQKKIGSPLAWQDWANVTMQEFDEFVHGTSGQLTPA